MCAATRLAAAFLTTFADFFAVFLADLPAMVFTPRLRRCVARCATG